MRPATRITPLPPSKESLIASWKGTPSAHAWRRVGLVAIAGVGLTLTMLFSLFAMQSGPIPIKWWPDIRPVLMIGTTTLVGLYASFGGSGRRSHFLYYCVSVIVIFHLDQATIHWVFPWSGPIGDTRVSLVRTAGSIAAIAAALLIQADHHAVTTGRDLVARGVSRKLASSAIDAIYAGARSRVLGLAVGAGGIAVAIRILEIVFGNASFNAWVGVVIGGIVLAGLAFIAWKSSAAPAARA